MPRIPLFGRLAATGLVASAVLLLGSACTAAGALVTLAGVSTDTSMTWTVVKYFHAQMTEGDARPCIQLNSVQRALSPRCGAFVPGSIAAADIPRTGLAECALGLAARDPRLWPVLPELLDKGAAPATCSQAPLAQLAQREPCPDFAGAAPPSINGLRRLAQNDPRSVHHDVMRMLSCPGARQAGLDGELVRWRERGLLKPGSLGFSPLGALHPEALAALPLARDLEADGHRAQAALGGYDGRLPSGFEEALRTSQWAALEWWFQRLPDLANRVPPTQGDQLTWLPLARVLVPSFLAFPDSQRDMVGFLLAHGADPRQRLPSNTDQSVLGFAKQLKSPLVALLEAPKARPAAPVALEPERFAVAPVRSSRLGE